MTTLVATLTQICVYIIASKSSVLVGECELKQTEGCRNCDRVSPDDCSISAIFQLKRDINLEGRKYSYKWFLNGTQMTDIINPINSIFDGYTGGQQNFSCSDKNVCAVKIQTHLDIPKSSSRLNTKGIYTIQFTIPEEESSCSTFVCMNSKTGLPGTEITGINSEGGILITDTHLYMLAGLGSFILIVIISLLITVIRLRRKANTERGLSRNDTQRQISDESIFSDDVTAVSNHTYASVQLSGTVTYQTLLNRNPEVRRYDQPSSDNNDDTNVERKKDTNRKSFKRQLSNFGTTLNAQIARLNAARTRPQQQDIPDIIVHDYQNIRRTRRLT